MNSTNNIEDQIIFDFAFAYLYKIIRDKAKPLLNEKNLIFFDPITSFKLNKTCLYGFITYPDDSIIAYSQDYHYPTKFIGYSNHGSPILDCDLNLDLISKKIVSLLKNNTFGVEKC